MRFVDRAIIDVQSGTGGSGCLAFKREKYVPFGGPIGGDGGKGGDVWLAIDRNANTLLDFRYRRHISAEKGRRGEGRGCTGRDGIDVSIMLPQGTKIFDEDTGLLLADLVMPDDHVCICRGGRGGRGNRRFATSRDRAPRRFEEGFPGENKRIRLELNVLADVGMIGMPNVGKSSLTRALTRSHTRVGNYDFTTLTPSLASLTTDIPGEEIILADLPGLVSGAAEGKGLGLRFLDHIGRCRLLLHILDASSDDPWDDYRRIRSEVLAHSADNIKLEEIIVLNKSDLLESGFQPVIAKDITQTVVLVSAISGAGLDVMVREIAKACRRLKQAGSDTGDQTSSSAWQDGDMSWHPLG